MFKIIQLFFLLSIVVGLLFVGAGIGHKSIDLVLHGAQWALISGIVSGLLHHARS